MRGLITHMRKAILGLETCFFSIIIITNFQLHFCAHGETLRDGNFLANEKNEKKTIGHFFNLRVKERIWELIGTWSKRHYQCIKVAYVRVKKSVEKSLVDLFQQPTKERYAHANGLCFVFTSKLVQMRIVKENWNEVKIKSRTGWARRISGSLGAIVDQCCGWTCKRVKKMKSTTKIPDSTYLFNEAIINQN
ncbi:hypothetical protein LguiA_001811 [Lonicera macranthoides]